jgi:hypothetical protein
VSVSEIEAQLDGGTRRLTGERFIVAIETSSNGRPLHVRLLIVRGFRTSEP